MTPPTLIDSHCHLHYDYAPKTTAEVVREASEAGVEILMTVGTDIETLPQVQQISEQFENVFHTVGIHPHDAAKMEDADIQTLEEASKHPKCKAIGEIGLDYYYEHSPHDIQIRRLKDQLALAQSVGLPVVIHSRDAEPDLQAALTDYAHGLPAGRVPGIIHCFTGTEPFARACIEMGFYISFSGILTFKNAGDLRAIARTLPLDRILVETDSPYLAPMPNRGKKCEPSMVRFTALLLAELRGIPFEELAQATNVNTRKAFGLPTRPASPSPA